MKSLFRVYAFSIFIAFLAGCSDSNIPDSYHASLSGHSLNSSKKQLSFDSNGGVENITVYANNVAWRFSGLPIWLTVSPNAGSSTTSVAFTASENLSADTARTAMFYLESADAAWSFRTMLSATQQAATSYITPAVKDLSFKGNGGSQTVNVLSNVSWEPSSSASWAKAEVSTDGKALTVSVDENPSDAPRTAIITLSSASGISSSINVNQEPAGVTGSTETLDFDKDGGTKTITITAEAAWGIKTSDSWISVTPSSGSAGSHMLSINVLENNSTSERSGYVYVNIGSSSKLQIPVVQKGLYIEVKPTSLSFSADAESKQLEISSNTDWSITSLPDWLTASSQSGKNSQTITLKSQLNTSASSRNGKIIIEKQGQSLSAVVDVLQEGLNLSVDNNSLQFGADASTQNIVINTLAGWTASCSEGWITLSQASGTGKSTLSISVEENNGDNYRTGSVRILAGELNQTITITQQGKYFNITESDKTFTSKGGTLQISFSTNDSWTASVSDNASWLTLSSRSGSGDAVINITAADNASMKSRESMIVITPSNGQGAKIGVKQDGRHLSVDTGILTFNSSGGTSDIININTDGTVSLSVTDSWMTIKEITQSSFTVTISENEGKSRRGRVWISMTGLANGETYETSIYVEQEGNDINGHEYVDLGLSVYWSSCNFGASTNTGIGDYLNWNDALSKVSNWGGGWRLPTKDEYQELIDKCKASGEIINGVKVLKITGPNGHSIYLPLSGVNMRTGVEMVGDKGFYWSQTSNMSDSHYCLDARFNYAYIYSMVSDSWLMNIRPVIKK